jgi:FAD/FMN-containing dehydrogenase
VKSEWLDDLDDRALDDLVEAATSPSSPYNQVLLRQLGGATSRIEADATACTFRDAKHLLTVVGAWDPDTDGGPHVAWARDVWSRLCRISSGGGYVNQLDADEGTDRTRDAYGASTWDRLTELKARWDPDNVFRLNANVPPARR